jgi:hypothetical protein
MTCHDAREQLSALLDGALPAADRQALDAHLATCADCRRELDQLRGTVALLGRLPPVRAPAGFVDRVMVEVDRPSRLRRLLDALFRPLRTKLPLEAAAVLLIGVSALYLYQRTPEVQQLARQDTRESSPSSEVAPAPPAAPPAGGVGGEEPSFRDRLSEAKRAPAERDAAREEARPAPRPATPLARSAPPAPTARRGNVEKAPAAKTEAGPEQGFGTRAGPPAGPPAGKEAEVARRPDAGGPGSPPAGTDTYGAATEPAPSRDAAGARVATAPAEPGTPPAPAPEASGRTGGVASAPSAAPAPEGALGGARSTAKSRTAARLMRAVDASGRLTVPAREPAEAALDALLRRLGGTRAARRVEGPLVLIDVVVPGARYRELVEGLGRIGRWATDYESPSLPAEARVEVAVAVEP